MLARDAPQHARPSSSNFYFFILNTDAVKAKYMLYIVQNTETVRSKITQTDGQYPSPRQLLVMVKMGPKFFLLC